MVVDVDLGDGNGVAEFTSDKAWGDEGYLTDRGLIPMPEKERAKYAKDAENLNPLSK